MGQINDKLPLSRRWLRCGWPLMRRGVLYKTPNSSNKMTIDSGTPRSQRMTGMGVLLVKVSSK